ncbi:MAG: hypothetical protein SGILL_006839, partial [Bacillariaceae sp.]
PINVPFIQFIHRLYTLSHTLEVAMAESETGTDNASWKKLALDLKPGDRKPEASVRAQGSAILYACQLSSSFGVFTMNIEDGNDGDDNSDETNDSTTTDRLDVVLKKDDGWDPTEIADMMEHIKEEEIDSNNHKVRISVQGFLERCRPKSEQDTPSISLHAHVLRIWKNSEDIMEWETVTATPELKRNPCKEFANGTPPQKNTGKWRGAKDDTRFSKFVAFLLEHFGGYEALSKNPVMDIAGGAGGLAFELSVRHALECIVVDTKPLRFKAKQIRHVRFRKDCVDRLQGQPNMKQSPLAQNLLRRFQVDCDLETLQVNQFQILLDSKHVLHAPGTRTGMILRQDADAERLRSILRNKKCSILVGLHPDQATDHIIDIGLALNIPWAAVPCCVFPTLFQHRKTSTGKIVRSYEDYCDWIKDKHVDVQEAELPFRGRNKVLYWIPPGWDDS